MPTRTIPNCSCCLNCCRPCGKCLPKYVNVQLLSVTHDYTHENACRNTMCNLAFTSGAIWQWETFDDPPQTGYRPKQCNDPNDIHASDRSRNYGVGAGTCTLCWDRFDRCYTLAELQAINDCFLINGGGAYFGGGAAVTLGCNFGDRIELTLSFLSGPSAPFTPPCVSAGGYTGVPISYYYNPSGPPIVATQWFSHGTICDQYGWVSETWDFYMLSQNDGGSTITGTIIAYAAD